MCTLTINEIDDVLEHEINVKAEAFGLTQAETVKKILADTLLSDKIGQRRKMFEPFCGIWTDEDAAEFKKATKDFEAIDLRDWE